MDQDYTMLFRSITLLLACAGGILSILLGWRLYTKGVESAVDSDLSANDKFRLKITSVGPGIFFALFGMYIVVKVVGMQAEIEEEIPVEAAQAQAPSASLSIIPRAWAADRPKTCMMIRRVRRQYTGSELTPDEINSALDDALRVLSTSVVKQSDEARRVRNVQTLQEMRASTGRWQLR